VRRQLTASQLPNRTKNRKKIKQKRFAENAVHVFTVHTRSSTFRQSLMVPDGKSELVCTKMSSTEPNERNNSYQQLLTAILKILASFRLSSRHCPDQSWKKPRFSDILKAIGLLVFKGFLRF